MPENTVARRMAELGLAGRAPKKPRSLIRQGKRPAASDLVRRKFTAVAPDVLWVGDVTMIHTHEGPLYVASVEDLFPRRLLGYAMSEHHDTALTVASLQMAVATRGGDVDGVIFHSDRGSGYTAARYQAECRKHGWRSPWVGSGARSATELPSRSTAHRALVRAAVAFVRLA